MKYLPLLLFLLGISSLSQAESDRPDLEVSVLQKPYVVKSIYREAWMIDNIPELSAISQLKLMHGNSPDLDPNTHKIMQRGTKTLEAIQFGTKSTDLSTQSSAIKENPQKSLSKLNDKIKPTNSSVDALEVADIMDASENLNKKVDSQNKIGKHSYNIDIELFK